MNDSPQRSTRPPARGPQGRRTVAPAAAPASEPVAPVADEPAADVAAYRCRGFLRASDPEGVRRIYARPDDDATYADIRLADIVDPATIDPAVVVDQGPLARGQIALWVRGGATVVVVDPVATPDVRKRWPRG